MKIAYRTTWIPRGVIRNAVRWKVPLEEMPFLELGSTSFMAFYLQHRSENGTEVVVSSPSEVITTDLEILHERVDYLEDLIGAAGDALRKAREGLLGSPDPSTLERVDQCLEEISEFERVRAEAQRNHPGLLPWDTGSSVAALSEQAG